MTLKTWSNERVTDYDLNNNFNIARLNIARYNQNTYTSGLFRTGNIEYANGSLVFTPESPYNILLFLKYNSDIYCTGSRDSLIGFEITNNTTQQINYVGTKYINSTQSNNTHPCIVSSSLPISSTFISGVAMLPTPPYQVGDSYRAITETNHGMVMGSSYTLKFCGVHQTSNSSNNVTFIGSMTLEIGYLNYGNYDSGLTLFNGSSLSP